MTYNSFKFDKSESSFGISPLNWFPFRYLCLNIEINYGSKKYVYLTNNIQFF